MTIESGNGMGAIPAACERQAAEKLLICSDLLALAMPGSNPGMVMNGKTLPDTVRAMARQKRPQAVRDNGPPDS